jgi:hypothetical protein
MLENTNKGLLPHIDKEEMWHNTRQRITLITSYQKEWYMYMSDFELEQKPGMERCLTGTSHFPPLWKMETWDSQETNILEWLWNKLEYYYDCGKEYGGVFKN